MLATCYLPGRWPSKYCHLCKSLRPCSGWERVVSLLLDTSEFFRYAGNCIMIINFVVINFLFDLFGLTKSFIPLRKYFVFTPLHRISSSLEFRSLRSLHSSEKSFRKSPRPISIRRLKMLPFLHLGPINVVICNGTY